MLNIVTNAALERFIVTEMGYFVTVESLGVCCREEIKLLAIRCPRLGALQVVLEGVSVDNSTKLLSCPRLYGLESILDGVSVEDELQEHHRTMTSILHLIFAPKCQIKVNGMAFDIYREE